MKKLINRIDRRLTLVEDVSDEASYKDINSPDYDRQIAEDALWHTIGPLTDNPRWTAEWKSRSTPVPGFVPNGPAPKWTKEEIIMAYAGDPSLLDGMTKDNPKSPKYGRNGAPLYRQAMNQLRRFNKVGNFQALADAYNNGMYGLLNFMRRGKDQSRSPFISYVFRGVEGAITSGVGTNKESINALRDLKLLREVDTPQQARDMADSIKGEYQSISSDDFTPDNPYGIYSSKFYKLAMDYADALEKEDEVAVDSAERDIEDLIKRVKEDAIAVRGIGTGSEQAISTMDRQTSIPIKSIDVGRKGEDDSRTATMDIAEQPADGIEPEAIEYAIRSCLFYDLGATVGNIPRYQEIARQAGAEVGVNGLAVIGGPLTANELRYLIRNLGPYGLYYPGRGVLRKNVQIVRDAPNWWKPGEDPEIEKLPESDEIWKSIWLRAGSPPMEPTEISNEMTNEVRDLASNRIATKRTVQRKVSPDGTVREEAISKAAISTALKKAMVKFRVAAYLYTLEAEEDIDESLKTDRYRDFKTIVENVDYIDRCMINDAFAFINRRIQLSLLGQYAVK